MDIFELEQMFGAFKTMIEKNIHDDELLTLCLNYIRDIARTKSCTRVGIGGGIQFILDCISVEDHRGISWGGDHDVDILNTLRMLFFTSANIKFFMELDGFKLVSKLLRNWKHDKKHKLPGSD